MRLRAKCCKVRPIRQNSRACAREPHPCEIFDCTLLSESDNLPIHIRFVAVASVAGTGPLRRRSWNSLTIESDVSRVRLKFNGQKLETVRGPRVAADYKWDVSQLRTFWIYSRVPRGRAGKCWPGEGLRRIWPIAQVGALRHDWAADLSRRNRWDRHSCRSLRAVRREQIGIPMSSRSSAHSDRQACLSHR
jgi:hypothetical protein